MEFVLTGHRAHYMEEDSTQIGQGGCGLTAVQDQVILPTPLCISSLLPNRFFAFFFYAFVFIFLVKLLLEMQKLISIHTRPLYIFSLRCTADKIPKFLVLGRTIFSLKLLQIMSLFLAVIGGFWISFFPAHVSMQIAYTAFYFFLSILFYLIIYVKFHSVLLFPIQFPVPSLSLSCSML